MNTPSGEHKVSMSLAFRNYVCSFQYPSCYGQGPKESKQATGVFGNTGKRKVVEHPNEHSICENTMLTHPCFLKTRREAKIEEFEQRFLWWAKQQISISTHRSLSWGTMVLWSAVHQGSKLNQNNVGNY